MSEAQERIWAPTPQGSAFTGSRDWTFSLRGTTFTLRAERQEWTGSVFKLEGLKVATGIFWASVEFPWHWPWTLDKAVKVDGLPNFDAMILERAVATAIATETNRLAALESRVQEARPELLGWAKVARACCEAELRRKGALRRTSALALPERPPTLVALLSEPELVSQLNAQPQDLLEALKLWRNDFSSLIASHAEHTKRECADFFRTVETKPLTDEQVQAALCFDNRVLVIAAAGSGKTSTLVAKAGIALKKGYVSPESILLLAFNADAASELRHRLQTRLSRVGLPADSISAKTFHAFGLDVIGSATGKRPSLAPWLEGGQDLQKLLELAEGLRASDEHFRRNWDLLRVVFGPDSEEEQADSTASNGKQQFWTLNDELVKSRGELLIANWLFFNNVPYLYEAPYQVDTADEAHRQYTPDFYLPSVNAYLELWALDKDGNPPADFKGYREGMKWKRSVHSANGTALLEVTSAQVWSGAAFAHLEAELSRLGVTLSPEPDRPAKGRKPIESPRLARTFRTFHVHAKSNRLSFGQLRSRLEAGSSGEFSFRHSLFLSLYEALAKSWEMSLRSEGVIDFEDMLRLAAEHIESSAWQSPFELVMVDEFQDASQDRARILRALQAQRETCLFAVGDDWQSINRFAGADISVMTRFETVFGGATVLRLSETFRCSQPLADVSGEFIQQNPGQLKKAVRSKRDAILHPLTIVRVADVRIESMAAVSAALERIAGEAQARASVFVLGRYNSDRRYLPTHYDRSKLDVHFLTAHSSKGLEADHVILPAMTNETLGFPSGMTDDPVLKLAMPGGDSYPHSEERRLFYVALTRAKTSVTLVTQAGRESPFVTELVKRHRLRVIDASGQESQLEVCPDCSRGLLVLRNGRYGEFYGCNRYPGCSYTRDASQAKHGTGASGARLAAGQQATKRRRKRL